MSIISRYFSTLRRTIEAYGRLNLGLIAAGVAFFGMLSLFPALAALIAVFGLFLDPVVALEVGRAVSDIIPSEAYAIIEGQMEALILAQGSALGFAGMLSVALAVWTARAGVGALILGLNTIYGVRDRGSVRHYLTSILLTMLLILVAGVALAMVFVAPLILALVPVWAEGSVFAYGARWVLALAAILTGLGALYRFGPNAKGRRTPLFSSGALLATVLWFCSSYGFSTYLTYFGSYNEVYGSIGAVVALMMWFYIGAFLVLFGAAWNAELGRERAPERAE